MTTDRLVSHGIQEPLIDAWKNVGITTLTECQSQVLSYQPPLGGEEHPHCCSHIIGQNLCWRGFGCKIGVLVKESNFPCAV